MRSLCIDSVFDEKVQRAAAIKGESVSELIRHAAEERADETLNDRLGGFQRVGRHRWRWWTGAPPG